MNILDHTNITSFQEIEKLLSQFGCETVLIKALTKNNNDKNQVYIHSNPDFLNSIFDLTFNDREPSTSQKKKGKRLPIPEARFNAFAWIATDGNAHEVAHCKGILYAQYPEVRLSGFLSTTGLMPHSMSITFTKEQPETKRYLAIGATSGGKAYALMLVNPSLNFQQSFEKQSYHPDSKACKIITIKQTQTNSEKLKILLKERIANKNVKGCRLTPEKETVPFTGTQVHGYTLEHELGITTNADKDGDIFGIELKCFTNKKLTLFTPEPDGGLYCKSFEEFMRRYGYSKEAVYRFTGLYRNNQVNEKSQLKLAVLCSPKDDSNTLLDYDITKPFKHQLNNLQVVLIDEDNYIAASWSITRLFNNWGVKHNEVVYVPATVTDNTVRSEIELGFSRRVSFGGEVLWCKKSTLERMIKAIVNGTIFLDPAPKFDPDNPKNNKRRSQWRINNIYRDAPNLYESVENIIL